MTGFIKVHDFSTNDVLFVSVLNILAFYVSENNDYVGATVIDFGKPNGAMYSFYVIESLEQVCELIEAATY